MFDFLNFDQAFKLQSFTPPAVAETLAFDRHQFIETYKNHKKPKIALLMYRELSADLQDVKTTHRMAGALKNNDTTKELILARQKSTNDTGQRYSANNNWTWHFDDALVEDFLESGVKLVDRATIMRLVAADADDIKNSTGLLNVKKIEVEALKGYAAYFIELQVVPTLSNDLAMEVKATIKSIKTGEILAVASTLLLQTPKIIAPEEPLPVGNTSDTVLPDNYQPQFGKAITIKHFLTPAEQAKWLSNQLQGKLARYWQLN